MEGFEHLLNFRDFRHYRRNQGPPLPGNVFARSNNPDFLSTEELAELKRRGLTCVVDLRRDAEVAARPDFLAAQPEFTYHHIIMNDELYTNFNAGLTPEEGAAAYFSKLTVSADRIRLIFQVFAQSDAGVLFHCQSGKDRTGTIAALLLLLLDVKSEDIVEDYRLSYDRMYFGDNEGLLHDPTLVPKVETMEIFLSHFDKKYRNSEAYLLEIGLSEAELGRIRAKVGQG